MPTDKPRVTITMTREQLSNIEKYRFDKKMKNQTQAILSLINRGFDELEKSNHKQGINNASSLSDEAMQIARKYDNLDDYGQRLAKIVINEELNRVYKEGDKPFILAAARTGERFVANPITEDDLPPETTKIP